MTTPTKPTDIADIRARYAAFEGARGSAPDAWPFAAAASAADVPLLLAEVTRLRARFEAAASLTRDTDGNQLGPDENIPVGELQRALFDVAW